MIYHFKGNLLQLLLLLFEENPFRSSIVSVFATVLVNIFDCHSLHFPGLNIQEFPDPNFFD